MFGNSERYINNRLRQESSKSSSEGRSLPYYLTLEIQRISQEDLRELNKLQHELECGIADIHEAMDVIEELREYTDPIISVPRLYLSEIKRQGKISAVPTWTGHKLLVATIGRSPYLPDSSRVLFRVKKHVRVVPRMTGRSSNFFGVVGINSDILHLGRDIEVI